MIFTSTSTSTSTAFLFLKMCGGKDGKWLNLARDVAKYWIQIGGLAEGQTLE